MPNPSNRELKQRRRRRLRKRHLRSSNLYALIPLRSTCQILVNFSGVEFLSAVCNSEKEIEIRCLVLTSSTLREIKKFHFVYLQRRQRNVQKSVMNVQSCCFADLNLLRCCRFHCRRRCLCLSSLISSLFGITCVLTALK